MLCRNRKSLVVDDSKIFSFKIFFISLQKYFFRSDFVSYSRFQSLSFKCRGAATQSVERPKGPSLVQLYLTDVGSNPERAMSSHLGLITPRHKVVGKISSPKPSYAICGWRQKWERGKVSRSRPDFQTETWKPKKFRVFETNPGNSEIHPSRPAAKLFRYENRSNQFDRSLAWSRTSSESWISLGIEIVN